MNSQQVNDLSSFVESIEGDQSVRKTTDFLQKVLKEKMKTEAVLSGFCK